MGGGSRYVERFRYRLRFSRGALLRRVGSGGGGVFLPVVEHAGVVLGRVDHRPHHDLRTRSSSVKDSPFGCVEKCVKNNGRMFVQKVHKKIAPFCESNTR